MPRRRRRLEHALPFAMEPVVYDFAINEHGTFAALLHEAAPPCSRRLLRADGPAVAADRTRATLSRFPPSGVGAFRRRLPHASRAGAAWSQTLFDRLLPQRAR